MPRRSDSTTPVTRPTEHRSRPAVTRPTVAGSSVACSAVAHAGPAARPEHTTGRRLTARERERPTTTVRPRLTNRRTRRLLLPSTGTRTIRGARCRCPTIAGASIATPRPTAVPTPIPSGRASTLAVARSGAVTRTRRTRTPTTRALGPIPRTRTGTPTTRALGAIAFSAARAFAPEARAAGALTRAEAPASTLAGVRGTALAATATASATPRASRPTRAGDRGSTPTQQSKAQARGSSNYSDSMLRDVRHLPTLGTDL